MNYIFCPKCQKVRKASFNRSNHIVCGTCKTDYKVKQFCCKQCPDCGSLLYAPPADLERSEFPCRPEHLLEKEARRKAAEKRRKQETEQTAESVQDAPDAQLSTEAPAQEQPAQYIPDSAVPSARQDEMPPVSNEADRSCFAGEKKHDGGQPGGSAKFVQFKWDPAPLELLHVAESSDAIPPHSILIVGDQQEAYYFAGGARHCFDEEGTYPLFDDPRTEDEIIEGMYLGNTSEDSLAYKLNTRILFFDKHQQQLSFQADFSLLNSAWRVSLPFDLTFQICETENLLRNQKDFGDAAGAVKELIRQIQVEVKQEMSERLLCIPSDKLAEAETEENVRSLLFDVLNRETEAVRQSVNRLLVQRFGLNIIFLRPRLVSAAFINTAMAERVVCPKCGKEIWTEKGNRGRIQCPSCGIRLSWCFMCQKFTESMITDAKEEKCANPMCGYIKI